MKNKLNGSESHRCQRAVWNQRGTAFQINAGAASTPQLPPGIYEIVFTMTGVFLNRTRDAFWLPGKLYGNPEAFAQRVLKTWRETSGNLGILLNGVRGTGKTVTAELIANLSNLPIVLITSWNDGIPDYLSGIPDDLIVFIDEFEKVVRGGDGDPLRSSDSDGATLLPLMDGALKTEARRMFLLTTNKTRVNENLMQRPGRVRYLKEYTNLQVDAITEIVNDKLLDKNRARAVVEQIAQLELITVDIVCSICEEVNIHGENPEVFYPFFNVEKIRSRFRVVTVPQDANEKPIVIAENAKVNIPYFQEHNVGDGLYVDGLGGLGTIKEVISYNTAVVQMVRLARGKKVIHRGGLVQVCVESQATYNAVFRTRAGAIDHSMFD